MTKTPKDKQAQGRNNCRIFGQVTKNVYINAPIRYYSRCRYFQFKKKNYSYDGCPNPFYLNTPLLIIYLTIVETLNCHKGFTSSVLHKIRYIIFEIPYWTHSGIVFDKTWSIMGLPHDHDTITVAFLLDDRLIFLRSRSGHCPGNLVATSN